jgi:hypothetical protein
MLQGGMPEVLWFSGTNGRLAHPLGGQSKPVWRILPTPAPDPSHADELAHLAQHKQRLCCFHPAPASPYLPPFLLSCHPSSPWASSWHLQFHRRSDHPERHVAAPAGFVYHRTLPLVVGGRCTVQGHQMWVCSSPRADLPVCPGHLAASAIVLGCPPHAARLLDSAESVIVPSYLNPVRAVDGSHSCSCLA